ncbi:MAG: c-type cytochrome [Phycisphaerales bacterium]|nr:c-type cytochrome [Phycisphaerales bacterium]
MMMPVLASTEPGFLQKFIFGGYSASRPGAQSDALFMMILWFSIFFFVLLMGLMIFFVIKYRRRPGVPAIPSPNHNTLLEIFWTVVPSSSMLVFFVLGFQSCTEKMVVPDNAMELNITAVKWSWDVTYPNGAKSPESQPLSYHKDPVTGVVTKGRDFPIFYIPENTDVRLKMISVDVIHSFWIPDFRTKMDVIPNRYTGYGFRTPALTVDDIMPDGETIQRDMWIFCAEYCGDEHSRMAATLRVVPMDVFEQKMMEWNKPKSPVVHGQQLWKQMCAACHTVDGKASTGPTLSRATIDGVEFGYGYDAQLVGGTMVPRDDNYYRRAILDPHSEVIVGYNPVMSDFSGLLDEDAVFALIAFIKNLSDRGTAGDSSEESDNSEAAESAGGDS